MVRQMLTLASFEDRNGAAKGECNLAEEVRTAFTKYRQVANEYVEFRDEQVFKPLLEGRHDAALLATKQGAARFEAAIRGINETIEVKTDIAKKRFEESQTVYASSRTLMVELVIGGLLLGLGLGYTIARLIARPLTQAVGVLQAVADGGWFLTCSCTGLVSEEDFLESLRRASWQAGRTVQVLRVSGAGPGPRARSRTACAPLRSLRRRTRIGRPQT